MECTIRQMGANDRAIWAEMRIALWPEETPREHAEMTDEVLDNGDVWGLIAEAADGIAIGFAEIAVRNTLTAAIRGLSHFSKVFGSNRGSGGEESERV